MLRSRTAEITAVILFAGLAATTARADIPPPDGMTRIDYKFRVDAVPAGMTAIAFPTYNPDDDGGHVLPLVADRDVSTFQGYRPGIHVIPTAEAASLTGKSDDAVKAILAANGQTCLKEVPRVFTLATTTGISQISDVIHITATAGACSAQLVKTIYKGTDGKSGEGGVDATGHRTPPPPFGKDIPDVNAAGFAASAAPAPAPTPTPPATVTPPPATPAPAHKPEAASTGCNTTGDAGHAWLWLAVPLTLLARRRR